VSKKFTHLYTYINQNPYFSREYALYLISQECRAKCLHLSVRLNSRLSTGGIRVKEA